MGHIFISYSHKDREYVHKLQKALQNEGFEVWIDDRIDFGTTWPKIIQENLDACSAFIVVMTEDAYASKWVHNEVTRAERKGKPFYALLLGGDTWLSLEAVQYENVTGGKLPSKKFYETLAQITLHEEKPPPPAPPSQLLSRDVIAKIFPAAKLAGILLIVGAIIWVGSLAIPAIASLSPTATVAATLTLLPKSITPTQQITTSSSLEPGLTPAETAVVPDKSIHDGAKLVYIPEGEFVRGLSEEQLNLIISLCSECKRNYVDDELPQTRIYLDAFWIDEEEVTNAQFARFVDETGYVTSAEKKLNDATYVFDLGIKGFVFTADADWQHPHGKSSNINGLDTLPVTQVSWDDANAYCEWAGRRLPTEAEWEKAARGTDGALFVWGNEPPSSQLLNFNLQFQGPRPVGSYDMGVSPYGIYDMAGNLWEWVSDYYNETYFQTAPNKNPTGPTSGDGHVLRGGSWASEYKDLYLVTATSRIWNWSYTRSDVLGFRCAMDAIP